MTKYIVNSNAMINAEYLEELIYLGMMAKHGYTDKDLMLSHFGWDCYLRVAEADKKTYTIAPHEGKWVCFNEGTIFVGEGDSPMQALENYNYDEISGYHYGN